MKVLVSACLLGENCKYNGENNYDERVEKFLEGCEVVPVCPEVLGGLPVPRTPVELCGVHAQNADGEIFDAQFQKGVNEAMNKALAEKIDFAILQPRSPSCGVREIYDGSFSGKLIPGEGMFATRLRLYGIDAFEPDEIPELEKLLEERDSMFEQNTPQSRRFARFRALFGGGGARCK